MTPGVLKPAAWGIALTLMLAALIVIGSRSLAHFDAALVGYTFSILFATFGITYRYAMGDGLSDRYVHGVHDAAD